MEPILAVATLRILNFTTGPLIALTLAGFGLAIKLVAFWTANAQTAKGIRRLSRTLLVTAAVLFVITTVLYVPFAMAVCYVEDGLLRTWHDEINVQGTVIDARTGETVENARVVVTASYQIYMAYRPYAFGTTTNQNGNFNIKATLPESCNYIWIEVCTPENKYARVEYQANRIVLKAEPHVKAVREDWYSEFAGSGYVRRLTFFGEPWAIDREN